MPPLHRVARPLFNTLFEHTPSTTSKTTRHIRHLHQHPHPPSPPRKPTTHCQKHRNIHTTTPCPASQVSTPRTRRNLQNHDRGPTSKEDTQTDFGALNVLGSTANPSTSIDICTHDGFMLDSGLRISEGDGVILTGSEAVVWRPWMGGISGDGAGASVKNSGSRSDESGVGATGAGTGRRGGNIASGVQLAAQTGKSETERTGGVLNKLGQFEVPEQALGLFSVLWPRPDLLIIGTGATIRPLAPSTREHLQDLGMRLEVLDTRNAASTFNMMAVERGVQMIAAALVPVGFGRK